MDDLGATDALTSEPVPMDAPISRPMDFDLDFPSTPAPLESAAPAAAPPTFDPAEDLNALDLGDAMATPSQTPAPVAAAPAADAQMLSFDLDEINLDLAAPAEEAPAAGAAAEDLNGQENPLETKLSLAEEFRAIGDLEGARSLAEEVLAEASGTLKTKASAFLSDLN